MREKEVEMGIGGVLTKVKLRSLKAGQRNEALRKSSKPMNVASGNPIMEVDPYTFNEWRLFLSIVEPASLKSMDAIKDLEPVDFDKLVTEVNELNEITPLPSATSEGQ